MWCIPSTGNWQSPVGVWKKIRYNSWYLSVPGIMLIPSSQQPWNTVSYVSQNSSGCKWQKLPLKLVWKQRELCWLICKGGAGSRGSNNVIRSWELLFSSGLVSFLCKFSWPPSVSGLHLASFGTDSQDCQCLFPNGPSYTEYRSNNHLFKQKKKKKSKYSTSFSISSLFVHLISMI